MREIPIILIIEDDPYVQRMYKRMFQFKEYSVETAMTGETGLELAQNNPDLILLDIMLPGINGLEVLKKLKEEPKTQNIPVIVVTNLDEEEAAAEAVRLGALRFMVKADFSPEQILDEIDKELKQAGSGAN